MPERFGAIPDAVREIITFASADDLKLIDTLHAEEVFLPFEKDQQHHNIAFNGCSDGHRIHLWKLHLEHCRPQFGGCFHPFMDQGQGLMLAAHSPLILPDVGRHKVEQLRLAYSVVKTCIEQVVITHHWPCKAAALAGLTMLEALTYFVCGKFRLRHDLPDSPPIALYHKADAAHGVTITDAVNAKRFVEWLESNDRPEIEIIYRHRSILSRR